MLVVKTNFLTGEKITKFPIMCYKQTKGGLKESSSIVIKALSSAYANIKRFSLISSKCVCFAITSVFRFLRMALNVRTLSGERESINLKVFVCGWLTSYIYTWPQRLNEEVDTNGQHKGRRRKVVCCQNTVMGQHWVRLEQFDENVQNSTS